MWRRNYQAWGYSPLDQVNAGQRQEPAPRSGPPACTAGRQEGHAAGPRRHHVLPQPTDAIRAMDAKTGDLLWEYKRAIPGDVRSYIRNIDDHRSIAIWDNLIFTTSVDDHVVALDAKTGKVV